MRSWNAVGFFCDDFRQEVRNRFSLMGVCPDNMRVPHIPGTFGRLGFFIRINVDVDADIGDILVIVKFADGTTNNVETIDAGTIKEEQKKALAAGLPIVGVHTQIVAQGLPIAVPGIMQIVVSVGDDQVVAGILNIQPGATSPSASAPQSSQSPSAS